MHQDPWQLERRTAALELIRQSDTYRLLALVGRLSYHDGIALRDSVKQWDSLRTTLRR